MREWAEGYGPSEPLSSMRNGIPLARKASQPRSRGPNYTLLSFAAVLSTLFLCRRCGLGVRNELSS